MDTNETASNDPGRRIAICAVAGTAAAQTPSPNAAPPNPA